MRLGKRVLLLSMAAVLAIGAAGCGGKKDDVITITNVSYDPTRELYERYNDMFEQYYKEQYGHQGHPVSWRFRLTGEVGGGGL